MNFLDVTFNLDSGVYKPYMKPNDTLLYVNKNSNHPPSILQNIPAGVNQRLSSISENEGVFNEAIPPYQNALKNSGYDTVLKYDENAKNLRRKKTRGRNITWFNPPFSANNWHLFPTHTQFAQNLQQKHDKGLLQMHAKLWASHVQTQCKNC